MWEGELDPHSDRSKFRHRVRKDAGGLPLGQLKFEHELHPRGSFQTVGIANPQVVLTSPNELNIKTQ